MFWRCRLYNKFLIKCPLQFLISISHSCISVYIYLSVYHCAYPCVRVNECNCVFIRWSRMCFASDNKTLWQFQDFQLCSGKKQEEDSRWGVTVGSLVRWDLSLRAATVWASLLSGSSPRPGRLSPSSIFLLSELRPHPVKDAGWSLSGHTPSEAIEMLECPFSVQERACGASL